MQNAKGLGKSILFGIRIQSRLCFAKPLISTKRAINPGEERETVLDECR